jgi:hypothetical protein
MGTDCEVNRQGAQPPRSETNHRDVESTEKKVLQANAREFFFRSRDSFQGKRCRHRLHLRPWESPRHALHPPAHSELFAGLRGFNLRS